MKKNMNTQGHDAFAPRLSVCPKVGQYTYFFFLLHQVLYKNIFNIYQEPHEYFVEIPSQRISVIGYFDTSLGF